MNIVTPLVGVWIEMELHTLMYIAWIVTPLVGVWIEIRVFLILKHLKKSRPSWACGLK